jgi:hypothetical protein
MTVWQVSFPSFMFPLPIQLMLLNKCLTGASTLGPFLAPNQETYSHKIPNLIIMILAIINSIQIYSRADSTV